MGGLDGEAGLGGLGIRVLDGLGLVEHDVGEGVVGQQRGVAPQLGVAGDPDARGLVAREVVVGRQHRGGDAGLEAGELGHPDGDDARGADDEAGAVAGARGEEGQHLHRLAQAHLVGQQRVGAEVAHAAEPGHAARLVGAEVGREALGLGRLAQEGVLPGPEVVVEAQGADGGVVEQREEEVARDGPILAAPVLGEVGDRRVVGHHALAGQDDGAPAGLEQELLLGGAQAMAAGLQAPGEAEAAGLLGRRLGVGVDGDLELLVAEDGEALLAHEAEAAAPVGELLADEALDAADVVDVPGARLLVVDEAGAVGDGVEAEEGLALLVGELLGRDRAGAEAALVLAALADPGAGEGEALGVELEGDLEPQGVVGPLGGLGLGGGRDGLRREGLAERVDLVGQQLLDLVDGGDGEGGAAGVVGQRGAPLEGAVGDLQHGADGLGLGLGDDLGGVGPQLQVPDHALRIQATPLGEVLLGKALLPVLRQRGEPALERLGRVRPIGRPGVRHQNPHPDSRPGGFARVKKGVSRP